jgi:DNA polymerase IV
MCNLYSITTNQAAILALFRVMNRYVFSDFEIITRSRSVSSAVANRDDLARLSIGLLESALPLPKAVRLLGVSLSSLRGEQDVELQLDFSI